MSTGAVSRRAGAAALAGAQVAERYGGRQKGSRNRFGGDHLQGHVKLA
jgi:hypothetical protein